MQGDREDMPADDETLIQALNDGDQDAFEVLLDRYEGKIFNLSLRITGCHADAMDCTQETFVRVYTRRDQYDPRWRFFSWLYRIAVNAALDCVQGRSRWAPETDAPSTEPGPDREALAHELDEELQSALLELPEEQRVVVLLRHLDGLAYAEIAEILATPEKTVKSRLFSARQRLRASLSARGLGPGPTGS